jgi:hypothetical protein
MLQSEAMQTTMLRMEIVGLKADADRRSHEMVEAQKKMDEFYHVARSETQRLEQQANRSLRGVRAPRDGVEYSTAGMCHPPQGMSDNQAMFEAENENWTRTWQDIEEFLSFSFPRIRSPHSRRSFGPRLARPKACELNLHVFHVEN